MTLEPTETPSKQDIDEYIETLKYVFREAHENPDIIRTAPHRSVTHQVDRVRVSDDPAKWALSWKTYLRQVPARFDFLPQGNLSLTAGAGMEPAPAVPI